MKMTLFTNMRSFSNFSKQWGSFKDCKPVIYNDSKRVSQKKKTKTKTKKKTEGDPNKRQGEMLSS